MNTRVIILSLAILFIGFNAQAQKKKGGNMMTDATTVQPTDTTPPAPPPMSLQQYVGLQQQVYKNAIQLGDINTALNAVHQILAIDNQNTYIDTLAYLYFNGGSYYQAILLGSQILTTRPDNAGILEVVAVSQQKLGLAKESLESYDKLQSLAPSVYNLYNIATLQYALKRFGECGQTIDMILKAEDNMEKINITDNTGASQQVPIKAAALNMLGVMALELKQTDVAVKSFQEALKLVPEFVLAKNNLAKVTATDE